MFSKIICTISLQILLLRSQLRRLLTPSRTPRYLHKSPSPQHLRRRASTFSSHSSCPPLDRSSHCSPNLILIPSLLTTTPIHRSRVPLLLRLVSYFSRPSSVSFFSTGPRLLELLPRVSLLINCMTHRVIDALQVPELLQGGMCFVELFPQVFLRVPPRQSHDAPRFPSSSSIA